MLCSKCHKVVNDKSQFCEYCGAQITDLPKKVGLPTSENSDETSIKLGVLSGANKEVIILNNHFYIDGQRVDNEKILEYESLGIIEWEDGAKSRVIASLIINDESGRNNSESKKRQNISCETPAASKSPNKFKTVYSEYSTVIWLSAVGIVLFLLLAIYFAPNDGKLIGKWTNITNGNTITFSSDNTYNFSLTSDFFGYTGDYGAYRVSGDIITLIPEDSEEGEEEDYSFKVRDGILSLKTDEIGLSVLTKGDYSK